MDAEMNDTQKNISRNEKALHTLHHYSTVH